MAGSGDLLHVVTNDNLPARRVALGRLVRNAAAPILTARVPGIFLPAPGAPVVGDVDPERAYVFPR